MVLLILAVIWATVLIYGYMVRAESRPAASIVDFRHTLQVLQHTQPSAGLGGADTLAQGMRPSPRTARPVRQAVPGNYSPAHRARAGARRVNAARRRRDVMFVLLMAVGTSFVLAMVLPMTALWILHLVTDGLLLGYVALLVHVRNVAAEREMKLRFLPSPSQPQPQPALLLRRSAN